VTARPPAPDLPPAVGTVRAGRSDVVGTVTLFVVLSVAYGVVRGVRSVELLDDMALWVLVPAAFLAARTALIEVSVGPGWVSSRGWLRRHWVRTDRLVRVDEAAHGIGDRLFVLVDDADRRASVSLRDVGRRPEMWRRFVADVERSIAGGAEASVRARRLLEDQGRTWRPPGRRGR